MYAVFGLSCLNTCYNQVDTDTYNTHNVKERHYGIDGFILSRLFMLSNFEIPLPSFSFPLAS